MKDLFIILLLLFLLWGGYSGIHYLGERANTQKTAMMEDGEPSEFINLNKSAIEEIKNNMPNEEEIKEEQLKKGEQAMKEIRGTRLDTEGQLRDKSEFYEDIVTEESLPYQRPETTVDQTITKEAENDEQEQKMAMAQKGKALKEEFTEKGGEVKSIFNVEKGALEKEKPVETTPKNYETTTEPRGNYLLVCGSFANPDNAQSEAKKLKAKGYNKVTIVPAKNKLHLVTINRFVSMEQARIEVKKVKAKGIDVFIKKL